ncbi:uncharacterized protein LOC124929161 [Impatiens glandulifera]|uniref:uncharacterized protein LOC124929161 n=1 Tax=Impatiens glandulifera TaxID=253017 RepID=UPI001FB12F1A|nr:uncharacterized protein LOC124929161 [Impatiens glandulifera]
MAKQTQIIFLEEWLKTNSGIGLKTELRNSSSTSARVIIQAWTDLRDSLQNQTLQPHQIQSLRNLVNSQTTVYVAEPQARLLLSILSSKTISLPSESFPLFLRLLYIWIRKSSKPTSSLIESTVEILSHLLSTQFRYHNDPFLFSEEVILLGALSSLSSASEKSRAVCLDLLCQLFKQSDRYIIVSSDQIVANILAGIGYALSSSSSSNHTFVRILGFLFGIWRDDDKLSVSISHTLMILHLVEWVISGLIRSKSLERIATFRQEALEIPKPDYPPFALVMAAAGALRASQRAVGNDLGQTRRSAEERIETICNDSLSGFHLKCISLALVRSGSISPRASFLHCLASAILTEIFPLKRLHMMIIQNLHGNGSSAEQVTNEVMEEHIDGTVFKEAGAITAVFCKQYLSADEDDKNLVENRIWEYCQDVYMGHRKVSFLLRGKSDKLLEDLEKIAESAFLMVVVFSSAVTKHKLDSRFSREMQIDISVKILVSFSCMGYFRRMRLPEYMDTIRAVFVNIQENESACASFVESMPPYANLTNQPGDSISPLTEYIWLKDEVQTARVLFYLRVISTCIDRVPASIFRNVVAPSMFLYMGHPNKKVARASHSVFAAIVSSGKDSDEDERAILKEQLIFYYMKRSLELYPEITPFEGMASGVVALVRNLPAGSPSIFYSIHCLVEKANNLFVEEDDELTENLLGGESDHRNRILDLLLRLLFLVDIQVLPELMKLFAGLISKLPKEVQDVVLNELHSQIGESDDVTRKSALISWLQSLSYICMQKTGGAETDKFTVLEPTDNTSPNGITARL